MCSELGFRRTTGSSSLAQTSKLNSTHCSVEAATGIEVPLPRVVGCNRASGVIRIHEGMRHHEQGTVLRTYIVHGQWNENTPRMCKAHE